jgi:hypothetical protein
MRISGGFDQFFLADSGGFFIRSGGFEKIHLATLLKKIKTQVSL